MKPVWNKWRVSKWHNFHFWVNFHYIFENTNILTFITGHIFLPAILLARLEHCMDKGKALDGFKSYLSNGSFIFPIACYFFLTYASLCSTFRKHGLSFHCYADDTQIYLPLKPSSSGLETLISCLSDVKASLSLNFLDLNESNWNNCVRLVKFF